MYIAGDEEIEAIARVIRSGHMFRYRENSECERFEQRYAKDLGVRHFALAASGTYGLAAGLVGLGIGPGDEVLVPAHTYMATATAVLAVGAIPVIVDVDETITISPAAIRDAIGPHTRAIIPVHMWGAACNMNEIMAIANERGLLVLEDVCQGIGGSYEGRKLGSIGHAGGFSFNYFKNMSCGEGGGLATSDDRVAERARCAIDPCHFYWQGRKEDIKPFAGIGARASELMGAMLNVQFDRLAPMVGKMRAEKKRILAGTRHLGNLGLKVAPMNSEDSDCATQVMFQLPTAAAAQAFTRVMPSVIAGKTGRHTFTQWDQVLMREGAHHPDLNPYTLPANEGLRTAYPEGMCTDTLEIVNRTVMIATSPLHGDEEIENMIHNIDQAARVALDHMTLENAVIRKTAAVDLQKFDSTAD